MEDLIFDKSVAFGLTPFETLYFFDYKVQYIREHYYRMRRACKVFNIGFAYDLKAFESMTNRFVADNSRGNGVLKIVAIDNGLHMKIREYGYDAEKYKEGYKLIVSKSIRDKNNIFSYFKTFNYGINYIEDTRAKKRGFDSSLHLNQDGYICEAAYSNIFFVRDRTLYTPSIKNGILNGIIRSKVMKLSSTAGYKIEKTDIKLKHVGEFDECFITNSVAGVFPVSAINQFLFSSTEFTNQINNFEEFRRQWNSD
jgi:4-amino-4-deoxychorismate lyase